MELSKESQQHESYSGLIVSYPFVNKVGEEKPEYAEDYFLCSDGEYFIKKSESHYKKDVKTLTNFYVKIDASINDGLWDTNDPNVQSRVGPYITIESIEVIDKPIKIVYNDGNANSYIIEPNSFVYDPITPMESSSGVYSGGDPKDFSIDQEKFNAIFIKAEELSKKESIMIDSRQKGTGFLKLTFEKSEKSFYISNCTELDEFEKYLKNIQ